MSLSERISRLEEAWALMGFRDFPKPAPHLWAEQMHRRGRAEREAEEAAETAAGAGPVAPAPQE